MTVRAWGQSLAAIGIVLAAATPAAATARLTLRVEHKADPFATLVETVRAMGSAALPVGAASASARLQLTTSVGGPAPRERLEGRLETRTRFVAPQIGCWRALSRGFFLGLELGWAVTSSAVRGEASPGRRDAGFAGLARPTVSIVHVGWSR